MNLSTIPTSATSASLYDKAMLVSLNIRNWQARKHDREISEEVARDHATGKPSDAVGRYNKILIDKAALKPIQEIISAARTHHYFNTLPWSDAGQRILPAANFFAYSEKQREFKAKFEAAARDFVADYEAHVAEARVRLNGMFREEDYPKPGELARKFAMAFEVMPIPSADDFRVSSLGAGEVEQIKAAIAERMEREFENAARDLWERIHERVSHMAERLRAYSVEVDPATGKTTTHGAFRDSLVENLRELVEVLPRLNVTGDAALARMAEELQADLCRHDAAELREDASLRRAVAMNAEDILAQMAGYTGAAA